MNNYSISFDKLQSIDPHLRSEWQEMIEPAILDEDQQLLAYILIYLFM